MNFPVFTLVNAYGQITVAEYGGQLLSWKDANGCEKLYTPENLQLQSGKALRGTLPKHGLMLIKVMLLLKGVLFGLASLERNTK